MSSTRVRRRVNAPRASVYRALLDARAVAQWMVPTGMTSHVHAFDAREGGSFRISLTYDAPTERGKTTAHTDTYHGRFVKLVTNERVVEVVEFETTDPALRGVAFAALCYLIATPGFRPRQPLVFALFAPAFFAYGVVLMLAWERFVRNRSLNATR